MNEARQKFTDLVNRAAYGKERIIIGRRDKDLAVLVPIEDGQWLEHLEELEDIREAKKALKEKGPNLKWDDVKKELGLK
jgi:prevent-host-death family protein